MSNELGIENIKVVLDELFDTSMVLHEHLKDGFQILTDAWPILQETKDIPVIISRAKVAYREVLDLSGEEHQELAEWAQDKWDIPETQIDDKIREALKLTAETHLYIETGINIFEKWKAWGEGLSPSEEE